MRNFLALLPVLSWALFTGLSAPARAETPAPAPTPRQLPLWELGIGGATGSQQAYPGAAEQTTRTLVLPYAIYRGQFLRSDSGTVGLRALRTPRFEFDLGVAGSLGSSSARIEARRGMPDLGTLIEAGPRLRWNLSGDETSGGWRMDLPLRAVFDVSDGFAHRGVAFEPRLTYESRVKGWRWSTSGGAIVGSRRLTDTFYGVAPQYATADRPAFEARAGLIAWRLSGSLSHSVTPDLRAFATLRLDSVAGASNAASPLVRDRTGWSAGIGFAWTLKRSQQPAFD
jgi:outer membrane scaffolding protein for murein synthesis (MipA/OmpV family)